MGGYGNASAPVRCWTGLAAGAACSDIAVGVVSWLGRSPLVQLPLLVVVSPTHALDQHVPAPYVYQTLPEKSQKTLCPHGLLPHLLQRVPGFGQSCLNLNATSMWPAGMVKKPWSRNTVVCSPRPPNGPPCPEPQAGAHWGHTAGEPSPMQLFKHIFSRSSLNTHVHTHPHPPYTQTRSHSRVHNPSLCRPNPEPSMKQ